jgi:hypothetical protein
MIHEPLEQIDFDASKLIEDHPPRLHHPHKQAVYQAACSSGYPFEGLIRYARWGEMPVPQAVTFHSRLSIRPGVFDYAPIAVKEKVEWHVNFADPHLFFAYGSALLAQDELQVAEHPILGSLREALISMGREAMTVGAQGKATPVTVSGVQRRVAIDTRPNMAVGCPHGLYGNLFSGAPVSKVIAATQAITPPTISNILAMAAPGYGHGVYTPAEILHILTTAYTGFMAAHSETGRSEGPYSRTIIHSGFWGCGAFGGNRILMTILQALAADLAGVELVFHAVDPRGAALAAEALAVYASILETSPEVPGILAALANKKFCWGVSDGN